MLDRFRDSYATVIKNFVSGSRYEECVANLPGIVHDVVRVDASDDEFAHTNTFKHRRSEKVERSARSERKHAFRAVTGRGVRGTRWQESELVSELAGGCGTTWYNVSDIVESASAAV